MTSARPAADPAGKPPHNKGRKFAPDPYAPEEVQAILGACSDKPTGIRDRALLTLMYYSGLRVSEALSLRTSSIDFRAHSARLLHTKSGVPQTRGFHPNADDALKRWIGVQQGLGIGPGPLFCRLRPPPGQPISARYVRALTKDLAERAGLDKRVHPHGFRYTYAVENRRSGADLAELKELLGHKNIAHTALYIDNLTNIEPIARLQERALPLLDDGKAAQVSQPEDLFDDYEEW
jgi:integrase/recombinase XerC